MECIPLSPLPYAPSKENVWQMSLCGLFRFSLFFPRGTSEEIKVTFPFIMSLIYYYFHVVRGTQNRAQNRPLKTSFNQTICSTTFMSSQSSDFLVKRQRHNWSNIFPSDWLSGDPYPHLHSAIWILMKVNGIISISKCLIHWGEGGEKRLLCIIHKSIWERAERGKYNCSVFINITQGTTPAIETEMWILCSFSATIFSLLFLSFSTLFHYLLP